MAQIWSETVATGYNERLMQQQRVAAAMPVLGFQGGLGIVVWMLGPAKLTI
jgi:hypothetical protein